MAQARPKAPRSIEEQLAGAQRMGSHLERLLTRGTGERAAAPGEGAAAGIVQAKLNLPRAAIEPEPEEIQAAAEEGTRGAGGSLPYLGEIQRSFGRHDVSHVKAHTDAGAAAGARVLEAEAFTQGEHVAFAGAPSLRTAAHEAAHVIQQRAGVQLKRGLGEVGDRYERHADAVAHTVVQGKSSEALLDDDAGAARRLSAHPRAGASPHREKAAAAPQVQLLKKGDFASLDAVGLDVDSWDKFDRRLEKIETASTLTVITNLLRAMQPTEDVFDALRRVELRKREVRPQQEPTLVDQYFGGKPEPLPAQQKPKPRPPTRDARVGIEFQMLDSKVEVLEKPEGDDDKKAEEEDDDDAGGFAFDRSGPLQDYLAAAGGVDEKIQVTHFGRNGWTVVADGENLEFVTAPFQAISDLHGVVGEIQQVALRIAASKVPRKFLIGDAVVHVKVAGTSAQPQINPDIPLDALPRLIGAVLDDKQMKEELFGAHGPFGWDKAKTLEELEHVRAAAQGIESKLPDQDLISTLGVSGEKDVLAAHLKTTRGMLLVLAQAVIHKGFYPRQLSKDQPILLKTDMARTWRALLRDKIVTKVKPGVVIGLLRAAYPPIAEAKDELAEIVTSVVQKGVDPVWSSERGPDDIADATKKKGTPRKQVLIELRRVPVIPIQGWWDFASKWLQFFVYNTQDLFE